MQTIRRMSPAIEAKKKSSMRLRMGSDLLAAIFHLARKQESSGSTNIESSLCRGKNARMQNTVSARGTALVLRKIRICFYLINLLGMPLAVRCAEKQEFISVPFLPKRTVRQMLAQIRSRLHQRDGFHPALEEMIERFGGSPAACRDELRRCLRFAAAVGNHSHNHRIHFGDVAIGRPGWRFHCLRE